MLFSLPPGCPRRASTGLERRGAYGTCAPGEFFAGALDPLRAALGPLLRSDPRLLLEDKGASLVLHYRRAPEREEECRHVMTELLRSRPELGRFRIVFGKRMVEAVPVGSNKGAAIRAFMGEAPFAGRRPMFVGDDLTDEDGFAVVAELSGLGIKVGEGPTSAPYRVDTVSTLLAWLRRLMPAWE